jgi:hypothetical protein
MSPTFVIRCADGATVTKDAIADFELTWRALTFIKVDNAFSAKNYIN